MRTTHEFRDFELSCEKHIMALASTKTGTYLSSSSGPSGPRTRMFRPLSGPSGPRVTELFFFFFFLVTTLPRALASALITIPYIRVCSCIFLVWKFYLYQFLPQSFGRFKPTAFPKFARDKFSSRRMVCFS